MKKIVLASMIAMLALALTGGVAFAGEPPEKTTMVAPSIGGPNNNHVKAKVAMVPDKSWHPVFEAEGNPAFGGTYPGEGEEGAPGKVFWSDGVGGGGQG